MFIKVAGCGLNLHYLPLFLRAKLMDQLYTIASDENYNEMTKLNLSYQVLKTASNLKYYAPCLKRYVYYDKDNVKKGNKRCLMSAFYEIPSSEYDIALFLPWQNFKKASDRKVWLDSLDKLSGIKRIKR